MFERGTVPPNSGESMPRGKNRDRKHVPHEIVSGKSQHSLKSPAKGEGFVKNSILTGKTSSLLTDQGKSDGKKCGQPIGVKQIGRIFDPPNKR